ncbi:MAG TPA: CsgG/HfaB family protein [Candidatus Angelobacter sp.]|nr:CsgG/HfaB family protein [Candidatus Angelobacter sp.]
MYKLPLSVPIAVLAIAAFGPKPLACQQGSAPAHKAAAPAKSGIDNVIELVKNGASESLVIKTLQKEGTAYKLSTGDLVRLQKAGVSENIINVMMDPKASVTASAPPSAPSDQQKGKETPQATASQTPAPAQTTANASAGDTPYPPDLNLPPVTQKRRVIVARFSYGAIKDTMQNFYANYYASQGMAVPATVQQTDDIGIGIRAMLMDRLRQSNVISVLDRDAAIDSELQRGPSSKTDQASKPRMGRTLGADCVVTGDIITFGRDDKQNHNSAAAGILGAWTKSLGAGFSTFGLTKKEEKAVVALAFRIVDTETSEAILSENARGESKRKSKNLDLGGLGIGGGGAAGGIFQNGQTSSGFEKTILGEATADAVDKIVQKLEVEIPKLPPKKRSIESRVAVIKTDGATLAVGSNAGVQMGDRFEILQITDVVRDPQTQEEIDVQTVKVGEMVVSEVREKTATGNYGGHPLAQAQITGKGYLARLAAK